MYFTVGPVSSLPEGITLLSRGTQFGYYDVPMVFQLTSTVVPAPFPIRFTVKLDATKPDGQLVNLGVTPQGLDLILYNPAGPMPTTMPQSVAVLGLAPQKVQLNIQFMLSRMATDIPHFLFYFEFHEQPISHGLEGMPTASTAVTTAAVPSDDDDS